MPSDLTVDLIADWELIVNANDSSVNVLNLIENGSAFAYGANGVVLNGTDQFLSRASEASLQTGNVDYYMMCEVIFNNLPSNSVDFPLMVKALDDGSDFEYDLFVYSVAFGLENKPTIQLGSPDYSEADASVAITSGPRFFIDAYNNSATKTLSVGVNLTTVDTVYTMDIATMGGHFLIGKGNFMGASTFADVTVRRARFWKGAGASIVAQAANRSWLYNSGAGRTYAEILATGVPAVPQRLGTSQYSLRT